MTTIIAIIDDDVVTMMTEKRGPQTSKVLPWRAFLGPSWPGWFLCSPSEPSELLGRQQAGPCLVLQVPPAREEGHRELRCCQFALVSPVLPAASPPLEPLSL